MLKSVILLLLTFSIFTASSQISINSTGFPPDSSAMLDINTNNKGFLIPRMSDTQILSIPNPANGLQVFCTSDEKIYVFLSAENSWKELAFGTSEIIRPSLITVGAGGNCSGTLINGIYMSGVPMISYNSVNIQVMVMLPGTWNLFTDTVNGFSFSGSGSFMFPGLQTISLTATGIPLTAQNTTFTAISPGNSGSCTFSVNVQSLPLCGMPITDSRDGKIYNTAMIYGQCWMTQNLNYGTKVAFTIQQTNNNIPEKYCYANNDANCTIYGGLYQWAETVQYVNGADNDTTWNPVPERNVTGICPEGWHLPTSTEWNILVTYLGNDSVAGGKLKETGTAHWLSPNQGATNSSGFTALGGGYRTVNSTTEGQKWSGNFWTATESITGNENLAQYFQLVYYLSRSAINDPGYKLSGYSVRCVKN